MPNNEFTYLYNGIEYPVIVTRKRMRSIRYRFKDGIFYVSAPYMFASQARIKEGLIKFAPRLIKTSEKPVSRGEDFIYILGSKVSLRDSGEITFTNGDVISYKNKEDFDKKLKKWFLKYISERNTYYEKLMDISKPYKVHVKKMRTRYGSNSSQTHSLSYSLDLLHYTNDVIDSVIIHELAHDKVRNHSKKFYDVVYKYCPNYPELRKRLRKGQFS